MRRQEIYFGIVKKSGPVEDFFTISIQCVFVSQCLIINFVNYLTGLYQLFWSSQALFGVSHRLRLAKVKLIGHPQIFLLYYVGHLRHQRWRWNLTLGTAVIPCGAVAKFSTGHWEAQGSILRRVLIFSTISIQCVFVSQCFIIDFIIIIIIFVVANLVTPYYFSYSVGKSEC